MLWVGVHAKARTVLLVAAALLVSAHALAEMKRVRVRTANFREGPSETADILFTADRYYPVKILDRKRGWAKIKDFEGETAWVAERLLVRKKGVVITVEHAIVRDKPSADGKRVFRAEWSDAFAVIRRNSGWILVEGPDGKQGWVRRDVTWGIE